MSRSRLSDAEIEALVREAERGTPIEAICASAAVSPRTFYRWRKRVGGLTPEAIRRLRTLEQENRSLRLLVGRLAGRNASGAWSAHLRDGGDGRGGANVREPSATVLETATGRHSGTGVTAGRFASLRAGRC